MSAPRILKTPRLCLRPWNDEDVPSFAQLNADSRVMEYFPNVLDRAQSDALAERIRANIDRDGFGLWAVEVPGGAAFIGFVGLAVPRFEAHFTPCVEIGWRLAREHWGHGYASEAATAALDFAFEELRLEEVVSFTATDNQRSRRVMQRMAMNRSPQDDFDHPLIEIGHPLCRHVLYRMSRARWFERRSQPATQVP